MLYSLGLLGASFVFLFVGAQLGPMLEGMAAFFFSWVLTFYFLDVLMEAVSVHDCQVLEWVPVHTHPVLVVVKITLAGN